MEKFQNKGVPKDIQINLSDIPKKLFPEVLR